MEKIPNIKSPKATERINAKALELLGKNKKGITWAELASKIKEWDKTLHPKTINGCIWKLAENFPEKIYKPSRGLFRLLKYK